MTRLLLTSGRGPTECRIALARTLPKVVSEARDYGLEVDVVNGSALDRHGPGSAIAVLRGDGTDEFAARWIGSIKWTFPSPVRPHHKRKNWFIGVFALPDQQVVAGTLDEKEVRLETFRAGGPGGQHQNTTDSAVRAIHQPSGLTVVARTQRSQHRNKADALTRLETLLRLSKDLAEIADRQSTQAAHDQLERGAPVRTFKIGR